MDDEPRGPLWPPHKVATKPAEFEFEVKYRPGRVYQVPDALSRLDNPSNPTNDVEPDLSGLGDTVLVTTSSTKRGNTPSTETPANPAIPVDDEDNETLEDHLEELDDTDVSDLNQLQDDATPV